MMFFKLSLKNIKKSLSNYTIYFITLIVGVAIFYTFNSIDSQTAMVGLTQSKIELVESIVQLMSIISVIVSIILGYLIVYANNFLLRRRKKEFGLYQTLGMSKRNIAKLLLTETLIIGVASLAVGLFVGIFLSQGMSIMVIHMFEVDLSRFQFAFSANAAVKSIVYFGVIYLVVMVINVFTVSRYKLINLLNASKKNEQLKVKNNMISFVLFIIGMGCIGYAYYLLRGKHVLLESVNETVLMLVLGAVGTYLFFSSLAGFLLKVVQSRKKLYYRNLNMFVLRQINSRVNTMKLSLTIIALMLLLTIGIMSSALSMVSAFNSDIEENNLTDFTLIQYNEEGMDTILNEFDKDGYAYKDYMDEYVEYNQYEMVNNIVECSEILGEEGTKAIKEEFGQMVEIDAVGIYAVRLSDFNKLMELYGQDTISMTDEQYAVVANFEQFVPYYEDTLKSQNSIQVGGNILTPYSEKCIPVPLQNSNMNSEMGMVILPDKVLDAAMDDFTIDATLVCGNYVGDNDEETEAAFKESLRKYYKKLDKSMPYTTSFTRIKMMESKISTSTIFTFLGLYLGIIFSITSAAILAIGQLSESSDNKERYAVLRKMGADDKMINRSLLLQIAIYFILPLAVAIIHSIVGIGEVSRLISLFGNMDLEKNITITALFLVIVYGAYFFATYMGSKRIIKEKEKYV